MKVIGGTNMRHFLDQKQNRRPIIHTFVCLGVDEYECASIYSLEDSRIIEWANAWIDAGWDPLVLTEKDAKLHPKYDKYVKQLKDAKMPTIRCHRYLRYIAMSMQDDGGWYADPSVIPLYPSESFDSDGSKLPNGGNFTVHHGDYANANLFSGSDNGWNAVTSAIIDDHELMSDVALLSILTRKSPDAYYRKQSIINTNHFLDSDLKPDVANCTVFDSKLAAIISDQSLESKYTIKDYQIAIKKAIHMCTPIIYTFFMEEYTNKITEVRSPTDIEEWKKAWMEAGWQPVVLSLEDAIKHTKYHELKEILDRGAIQKHDHEKMCFYRWLAVAVSGGGFMADYDVYPLDIDSNTYGRILPNNGKLTSHCGYSPCLVSGNEAEWNRIIPLLLYNLNKHNDQHWSDSIATRALVFLGQIISERQLVNIHEVHNNALLSDNSQSSGVKKTCEATQDKLAVHFSHFSCKKALFCDKDRSTVLSKWLDHWRRYCNKGKHTLGRYKNIK